MARAVPAATAALRVMKYLSGRPLPVSASHIAQVVGMPRSSTYHLLAAMAEEDFVIHYSEDKTWGIGIAAWEVGHGFAQQEPLGRLARIPLARLVDKVGQSAHLVMLSDADVLYVIEERAPGRPPLVTDVGVRLPAHLTASGRAILATLPPAQIRALYPGKAAFVTRTGKGPQSPTELRRLLSATRRRGYAWEDGEVTAGFSSLAAPIESTAIRASVAVTWDADSPASGRDPESTSRDVLAAVLKTAREISRRLGAKR